MTVGEKDPDLIQHGGGRLPTYRPTSSTTASTSSSSQCATRKKTRMEQPHLDCLQPLRYIAELLIILYHFYAHTPHRMLSRIALWGNMGLTFFFILSGFLLGYRYGPRQGRLDWTDFFIKRLSGLYPMYLLALAIGFAFHSAPPRPYGLMVVLLMSASALMPSAKENSINTPAWTMGSFIICYALFPDALNIMKALPRRFRTYLLPPILWLSTLLTPAMELRLNMGILQPVCVILAASCFLTFLLGVNLSLNYLNHDWSTHSPLLQRTGGTLSLVAMLSVATCVDAHTVLPQWAFLWKDMGLAAPLWCTMVWYYARDRDMLCPLLRWRPLVILGSSSYAHYLFQGTIYGWLALDDPKFNARGYVPLHIFLPALTLWSVTAYMWVQGVYTPLVYRWLRGMLEWGQGWRVDAQFSQIVNKKITEALRSSLASRWVREACLLALWASYVWYVNTPVCYPEACRYSKWKKRYVPSTLSDRRWYRPNDWWGAIGLFATQCYSQVLLSSPRTLHTLLLALSAMWRV